MKVTALCAYGTTNVLKMIIEQASYVLRELEVNIEVIELETLPYYKEGESSPLAQIIANKIQESRGIIAITSVHIAGIHSSMQSFLEHMEQYSGQIAQVPMLAIAHTQGIGERQATYQMLQAWNVIGGTDGGYLALNNNMPEDYIKIAVEKAIEGFYRVIKQERVSYSCSEALVIQKISNGIDQTSSTIQMTKDERTQETQYINLSTQEQNIQDFADLLKNKLCKTQEEFIQANSSIYANPTMMKEQPKSNNGIARLPHYFLPQYAKDLDLTIQYFIGNICQQGYITIKDGDCTYAEGTLMSPVLEITLTEELLQQIMTKKMTYQKAFMVGKIKVKGNFVLLPKLDQVFKAI